MKCPYCQAEDTGVVDTRTSEQGRVVRRRRVCAVCDRRFTTYERVDYDPILVVKKTGEQEIFSQEKLRDGLARACKKSVLKGESLENFVASIERSLRDEGRTQVRTDELSKMVLDGLKLIDPVAYVRFASVAHGFESLEEFQKILEDFPSRPGR